MAKNFKNNENEKGFIQIIIIIIMSIVIISLLGISLNELLSNKALNENFKLVWSLIKKTWDSYLIIPAKYIWSLWVMYVWNPFLKILTSKITQ